MQPTCKGRSPLNPGLLPKAVLFQLSGLPKAVLSLRHLCYNALKVIGR